MGAKRWPSAVRSESIRVETRPTAEIKANIYYFAVGLYLKMMCKLPQVCGAACFSIRDHMTLLVLSMELLLMFLIFKWVR